MPVGEAAASARIDLPGAPLLDPDGFNSTLDPMLTLDHSPVSSSSEVLGGTLVFRGTRVPAQTLIDYLNDGFSVEQFLQYFPTVRSEDAREFIRLIRSDDA